MKTEVEFSDGLLYKDNVQMYLTPINVFILILNKILETEDEVTCRKIFRDAIKKDAKIIYEQNKSKKISNLQKIEFILNFINTLGIGKIILKFNTNNKLVFIQDKKILSNIYFNLFKTEPKILLEEIFCGYLEESISLLFKKETLCEIKKENNIIKYEVLITQNNLKDNEKQIFSYEQKNNSINEKSNSLKRVIVNKHLIINEGICTLWGVYAILIPYCYFIELTKKLDREKYDSFFENLGILLGSVSVDLQRQLFGISKDLFKQVAEQTELVGTGKNQYSFNEENVLDFKYINNLEKHFKNKYSENELFLIKLYFRSLIRGVYQSSFEKTSLIEINKDEESFRLIPKNTTYELNKTQEKIKKYLNTKIIINK